MKNNNSMFFLFTLVFGIYAHDADDTVERKESGGVVTFQKGSLVVKYDEKQDTYTALKEKITRVIDNEMLHIVRQYIIDPSVHAEKAYWELYDAYRTGIMSDREPEETEVEF